MDGLPILEKIREEMARRNWGVKDLAERAGRPPAWTGPVSANSSIARILRGETERPSVQAIIQICEVLDIPFAGEGQKDRIPIIAFAAAGPGEIQFTDQGYPVGEGMETVGRPPDLDDPNAFGIQVHGDSMEPKYKEGDVVFVDTRKKPVNGDYAVVGLHSHERYIKRWRKRGTQILLESLNPAYEPIVALVTEIKFAFKIVWVRER